MTLQTLNMGLVLLPDHQWLDAAGPVDYINNYSHQMMSLLPLPQSIIDKAPVMNWHYISSDSTPVRATSGPVQTPTCTYENCPTLDYIVVPGPDPSKVPPAAFSKFLKERLEDPQMKGVLLICTAALAIANAGDGVLDGKQVCSNKMALRTLAEAGLLKGTNIKWVGDRRWVVDGKIWSSAGITAGLDLAAAFAKAHFDKVVVDLVKDFMEYEERDARPDSFARILEGVELS